MELVTGLATAGWWLWHGRSCWWWGHSPAQARAGQPRVLSRPCHGMNQFSGAHCSRSGTREVSELPRSARAGARQVMGAVLGSSSKHSCSSGVSAWSSTGVRCRLPWLKDRCASSGAAPLGAGWSPAGPGAKE